MIIADPNHALSVSLRYQLVSRIALFKSKVSSTKIKLVIFQHLYILVQANINFHPICAETSIGLFSYTKISFLPESCNCEQAPSVSQIIPESINNNLNLNDKISNDLMSIYLQEDKETNGLNV